MKTDYLDVVQFHASPSRRTLEEHGALDALLELREAGKVRFIGMSGTLPHLIDHIAMGIFDVFQIPYSAVEREHEAAIANAAQQGAGIVIRGGAAKGAPTEGKRTASLRPARHHSLLGNNKRCKPPQLVRSLWLPLPGLIQRWR